MLRASAARANLPENGGGRAEEMPGSWEAWQAAAAGRRHPGSEISSITASRPLCQRLQQLQSAYFSDNTRARRSFLFKPAFSAASGRLSCGAVHAAGAFSPLGCKCSGTPRIMHLACGFNIHAIRFHHTRRCLARLLICQKLCAKRGGFLVPVQLERLARPLGLLPLLRGRGQGGRLLALFFALRVRAGLAGAAVWGQSDALWRQGSAGPGLRPARPFPK